MTFSRGTCCALAYLLGSLSVWAQSVQFVPGSTVPRIQLTGEDFQIFSNGKYFTAPTPGQTLSRFGVLGTDLGAPISFPDKIVLLFGDTVGAYPSGGKYFQPRVLSPNGAGDSIGYIPNGDFSQCHYIGDVDQQLAQGVATPNVSSAACPSLSVYTDPSRAPEGQVFKPMVISGLLAEESQATFRVPTAGFAYNDRLYMFYITRIQESPTGHFALQSIAARSDQSPGSWSNANPPTFTRLYTVSSHPQIADPANPPAEAGDIGKFMFNTPVVMDSATLAGAGLTQGLPPALQSAPNVVFIFGTSYRPTLSNLYLAAFSLADADAGPSKWFYYKGGNQWSTNEADAAPLLATSGVSDQSVVWNSALRRFALMRIASGSVLAQFSTSPWGPWSDSATIFSRNDSWGTKLLHHPGADPLVQSLIPIHDRNGNPVALPDSDTGVPYSPNLLDKFTQNPDGSVTLYYTLSTWNPYQVFLMSSAFVIPATMALDKTSLQFAATSTGAAFVQQTQGQTVRLLQTGAGTVTWTATPNRPWITVSPSSGTGSATLTVTIQFASGLPASGTTSGTIALAFAGAGNTAGPITVGLTTIANGGSAAPSGAFDTPVDGTSGVTGSIAVTGWAIDDVEVTRVRIVRDPVTGEGASQVFIGTAVFVDGSRPDVAALNPTRPRNTRAGWGYLMLTNFLPNQGNGTFTLSAIADDVDGHSVVLGSRTITCTNATATRPFGAIDTPGQGEVISGTSYNNFGWVLARVATAYPPTGTVSVLIDGVFGPSPTGWVSRADLTALFLAATYPGVTNAAGVYTFDTTTLANGVHTIAWVVTTDTGLTDGIGSRYFTVANGTSLQGGLGRADLQMAGAAGHSLTIKAPPLMSGGRSDEVNAARLDRAAITGRRGYDVDAPFLPFRTDEDGRVTVSGEELDRFELRLPEISGQQYTGYLRASHDLGPLPVGSHLDPVTGVFTWHPGVGFIYAYDLVFVRCEGSPEGLRYGSLAHDGSVAQGFSPATCTRHEVRIVLNPKGSAQAGLHIVIDTPGQQRDVAQPFVVAGWAVDRDADVGTGIDAAHVWAYPLSGGDPIFVGVAAYGGERPDVGGLFGERFTTSGYGILVAGLEAGHYDLAVFAWSTARGGFVPAKVVRVTVR